MTDNQIVNLGINLICNMNDFEKGLTNWFAKPKADCIWQNFKTHFAKAQDTLRLLREPTMKSNILQGQVNLIL